MEDLDVLKNIEHKLTGILALQALSLFGDSKKITPEKLLHDIGIETSEIAKILGKKLPAVQKALQRSKK